MRTQTDEEIEQAGGASRWTAADIPRQGGRSAVITGTGGIGFETALQLARAGGQVIIAGRNAAKGAEAVDRVRNQVPAAAVQFEQLDLASLRSVREFCLRLQRQRESLDLLINNAAVMNPPKRQVTADGFELQFGTNYLGHFALTAGLMPLLRKGDEARVVTLSSIAARGGRIDFDDLQAERRYDPMRVYGQSKLACLMFAFELQRRSKAQGWGIASMAAHPGLSRTALLHNAPGRWSVVGIARSLLGFLLQPASQGAWPSLFAATSREAKGGGYYGPKSLEETRGVPGVAAIPSQALDVAAAGRLWEVSAELAGVGGQRFK